MVVADPQRTNGWRTAKRPGVDYFLAYLSLFYEIVLFTHQPSYVSRIDTRRHALTTDCHPCCRKARPLPGLHAVQALPRLDQDRQRQGCQGESKVSTLSANTHQQDLTYLNRDLGKVIMIDNNAEHAALQPDNAIIIPAWEGKGGDKGLVELIPFLECKCTLRRF